MEFRLIPGMRGPPAEFLRTQCHNIFGLMLRQSPIESRRYLQRMVKRTALHELVEFFHAYCGFCVDPSQMLSPLSELFGRSTFVNSIRYDRSYDFASVSDVVCG